MIISVRTIAGRAFYIEVDASDTIELVKRKIQRELGYPPHMQELFVDATGTGKWLRYGHTLADYNIRDGSTLRVVICTYRNPCFSPKFLPSFVGPEEYPVSSERDIFDAAESGDVTRLSTLIDAKAIVNIRTNYGKTPLHAAADSGHCGAVQVLIDANATVDAKYWGDFTPLHLAARRGDCDTVQMLLHARATVDARNVDDWTPLHVAASNGQSGAAKVLIDAKATIDVETSDDLTPLDVAVENGHSDTVQVLVDAKADVNNVKAWNGYTSLNVAAKKGYSDIVQILVNAGARIDVMNDKWQVAVCLAIERGYSSTVQILVDAIAAIDVEDRTDVLLSWAIYNVQIDILQVLINAKADINQQAWTRGSSTDDDYRCDCTLLHLAAWMGRRGVVQVLIDAKARIDAIDQDGCTPLHVAASMGNREDMRALLNAKAKMDVE